MRRLILLAALLLPAIALAQEWEYKVVYLDVPLQGGLSSKVTDAVQKDGDHYTNVNMNATLNALAKEGWELVSVTGNNISQTAFLRRKLN